MYHDNNLIVSGIKEDLFAPVESPKDEIIVDNNEVEQMEEKETISPEENKDDEEEKEIIDDFNPPPVIADEDTFLAQTPIIRFTTPIRRKREPSVEEEVSFPSIPPPNIKMMTPVPDYSDDDVVNQRVKNLISQSTDINYDQENEKVQDAALEAYTIKYQNLSINYPEYNITFPEGKSLNTIHKHYHEVIKSIYVNMNLGQTQLGYILCLMVLEFICVKAFNLPMAGFTKMELKRMYKYNALMIELGESMYSSGGGTPSPIEWRIASTFFWNVVIFLGIKIISSYIGGDSMVDIVRNVIDKMMDNPITPENIETGEARNINAQQNDVGDVFGNLFGGGGDGTSELTELISTLGTNFTEKMESSKKNTKSGPNKKKSRIIFNG